jgi:hypothetical protein
MNLGYWPAYIVFFINARSDCCKIFAIKIQTPENNSEKSPEHLRAFLIFVDYDFLKVIRLVGASQSCIPWSARHSRDSPLAYNAYTLRSWWNNSRSCSAPLPASAFR